MAGMPKDLDDASNEFILTFAEQFRQKGIMFLISMQMHEPNGVMGKDGRIKNHVKVAETSNEIICQALEYVAKHRGRDE